MDKILDSADNPLDGEGWWKMSEEPWQTLACCMEIANAVRSPNPEGSVKYIRLYSLWRPSFNLK
ncbi:DNA-directed RNA polymerase [Danaus plexippus plexippus]|uniref:DNA-directed RNA polymerase n=1 Tax=Danaus plexippus plexippus TaxID=278856 RepID=A0A212FPZ8_DANPL|nr:DNA-directed RNA polymerase [Danaus plexippus plexippus]